MADSPRNSRMAYYAELSQVGIEMAAPIGLGALIDYWGGWKFPTCAIIGAIVGLVGGLYHLVLLANREQSIPEDDADDTPGGGP